MQNAEINHRLELYSKYDKRFYFLLYLVIFLLSVSYRRMKYD